MKKLLIIIALTAGAFMQKSAAQNPIQPRENALLPIYYNIKDALVNGDAQLAATKSYDLANAIRETNPVIVKNRDQLLEDAEKISENKDLKNQRVSFAKLSTDMITLIKSIKLPAEPVYQLYCPMQKSSWLSNEKAVKNPYFGSSMLTCGQLTETFK